mgnify:CR=1 FL=1
MIRVSSGAKAVSFDGFVLEIFGMSGSDKSRRYALEQIEKLGVAGGKGEVMFMGKVPRGGGFGIAFPESKRAELEQLVAAFDEARAQIKG